MFCHIHLIIIAIQLINMNYKHLLSLGIVLTIAMTSIAQTKIARTQDPTLPYSYYTEEVSFSGKTDTALISGTLSLPSQQGKFPVVVLISGSGPQDRNEEVFNHRPFLVLADYLTRHGIGVLRYDDRGIGKSTGSFKAATSYDFAADASAAVDFLKKRKEIDTRNIGLIGHSEGGMIAPILATDRKDIAFIVLMAGPGIPIAELMDLQSRKMGALEGAPQDYLDKSSAFETGAFNIIKKSKNDSLGTQLENYFAKAIKELPAEMRPPTEEETKKLISAQAKQMSSPWFREFIRFDPTPYLEKIKCPLLAINGTLDAQVTASENLKGISTAMLKKKQSNYTITSYPGLNHLFQEAKTGSMGEYASIEQTISPKVLTDIQHWIDQQIKK
jgi:pimeloyl-ACP methyl ester carboxylesterase